ncbi:hypothetical protein PIB30_087903 [Stylosanthes scabra]|uniref:F-box domain-containing protein n=1 Tax=Stylosanthes scabra TaxID=79078 RepID=A0ABU6YRT9_9FABA|nr:hypothetical protein [Stylosanthes scabra]
MDRISAMPKAILHDILARLPHKEAAKTIALSKTWRDTWYSFPNLFVHWAYFFTKDDVPLGKSHRLGKSRRLGKSHMFSGLDNLIDYVTKRLLGLCDQGLALEEFNLNLGDLVDPALVSFHLDQWIRMAGEIGVKVLGLNLSSDYGRWDLPLCAIEAKSLTKLHLGNGIRIGQEFLKHFMKLSSVKMLSLTHVLFAHERIIEPFISHCSLTEHLTMYHCYIYNHLSREVPLESLFLHGLQKLKEVDLTGIQEVHIDSPNLENLCYTTLNCNAPFKLNFDSCTALRSLILIHLQNIANVDKWFLELFSKHPFLESLEILGCSMPERIDISSAQLKVLKLTFCSNLKEVNIDAPNLLSFYYHGADKPVISFMRSSDLLKVRVVTDVDFEHFYSLRESIWNIPQKILASLSLFIKRSFLEYGYAYLPELQVSSIPPSIKHLVVRVPDPDHQALYGRLMNYLFSSCFPKRISFTCGDHYNDTFIEFFYDMLMGSKKEECHCSSSDTKCWWHALKIVEISSSFMTNQNMDVKDMRDVWQLFCDEKATFRLEL